MYIPQNTVKTEGLYRETKHVFIVTVFGEQFVNVGMSIPASPVIPLPGVDTGKTFPHELKEMYVRMDMAILFAVIKERERENYPPTRQQIYDW